MSARANPHQNAWTKSFMGALKKEMPQAGGLLCREGAQTEILAFRRLPQHTAKTFGPWLQIATGLRGSIILTKLNNSLVQDFVATQGEVPR
jgi:hypothetical protein